MNAISASRSPPILGMFADAMGAQGYAGGFFTYVVLGVAATLVSAGFVRGRNRNVPA